MYMLLAQPLTEMYGRAMSKVDHFVLRAYLKSQIRAKIRYPILIVSVLISL